MHQRTICFVCEWNEGRSAHLELGVRKRLRERGVAVETLSAGLSQGGGVNTLRRQFLLDQGIPDGEIRNHRSTVYDARCARADLTLVAELQMKKRLLELRPETEGRVMTVMGFIEGMSADAEEITEYDAHIEDAGGHTDSEKLELYRELEVIADRVADRLSQDAERSPGNTDQQDAGRIGRFRAVFGDGHVVLPVIHVVTSAQALRNAGVARAAGANGIFLINHGMGWRELLQIHQQVVAAFPGWWVGVNCLDLKPREVVSHATSDIGGIWTDNAHINEEQQEQPKAVAVLDGRQSRGWPGLYFGGVAFKYQRHVHDLAQAARLAARYMDVVTTSGPGTGQAAMVDKIAVMKQALGAFPLAIASGITPENVADYLPHADCLLVATGISRTFEELDSSRVRALVDAVGDSR